MGLNLRRVLPFLTVAIGVAAIYDGAVFYSRWSSARDFEQKTAAAEAERLRRNVALAGDDSLKIGSFYAVPGVVKPGESANLCYSVRGAKKVTLEPAVAEVWPAMIHCVSVTPRKDTEFKLTAEDGEGKSVTESFVLKVSTSAR